MTFQDAIRRCFSKYVDFSGRARRSELWWFILFILLGNTILNIVDRLLFGVAAGGQPVSILGALFSLAVFLPSLAVGIRRLHDTDRSGWWYLLVLIPIVGPLVLIYFWIQRGTEGPNRFGADPLAGETA